MKVLLVLFSLSVIKVLLVLFNLSVYLLTEDQTCHTT